jgi:nitrogen fixation NifU-like protein
MDARSALYNQLILEHNKKPRNYGALEGATHKSEGLNPLCGDHIWIHAKVVDDTLEAIGFEGKSCAICQASASIMTTLVKGKKVEDAEQLIAGFRKVVVGQGDEVRATEKETKYLQAFAGISTLPSRVKCAVLPWHTLHAAFQDQATSSTEGEADPIPGSGLAPGAGPIS